MDTIFESNYDLMNSWKVNIENDRMHFNYDGIVDDVKWEKAPKKILFILKETNSAKQDLREAIQRSSEQKTGWHKGKVLRRVGRWANGLLNYDGDIPSFSDSKSNQFSAPLDIAYINLKKSCGGARTKEKDFHKHVHKYSNFIKQQIQIISPDIIVMCGTYKYLKKYIFSETEMVKVSERVHSINNQFVGINAWHPAARKKAEEMYNQVVKSFHNYQINKNSTTLFKTQKIESNKIEL